MSQTKIKTINFTLESSRLFFYSTTTTRCFLSSKKVKQIKRKLPFIYRTAGTKNVIGRVCINIKKKQRPYIPVLKILFDRHVAFLVYIYFPGVCVCVYICRCIHRPMNIVTAPTRSNIQQLLASLGDGRLHAVELMRRFEIVG